MKSFLNDTLDNLMQGVLKQDVMPNWSEIAKNIQEHLSIKNLQDFSKVID